MPEVKNPQIVPTVANLAAVLLFLRSQPGRSEQQVHAFQTFLSELSASGVDLRIRSMGLAVQGVPVAMDAPGAEQLAELLRGHCIGELRFPSKLPPGAILSVLRSLAMPAGHFDNLELLMQDIDPATRPLVHVSPLEETDAEVASLGEGFISDIELFSTASKQSVVKAEPMGRAPLAYVPVGRLEPALEELEADPADPAVRELLVQIVAACDTARGRGMHDRVFRAALVLAGLEPTLEDEELRRQYSMALRRMLARDSIDYIAKRIASPQRGDAVEVLRAVGADASEALLQLLVVSESMEERRAYYSALRAIATVSPMLVRLLSHEKWYVIRNVADLCGDLRAEHTVPQLALHVNHADERVRRAVAGALAKIATSGALEALRPLLRDASPQVRLAGVQALDGARARGFAMSLLLSLEDEANAHVQRELLLALGRIGTADAVQALARYATPGRFLNRRPVATRLAAVEGLRLASSPTADAALQELLQDDDDEVRRSVEAALKGR